jgi:hypothetical protein
MVYAAGKLLERPSIDKLVFSIMLGHNDCVYSFIIDDIFLDDAI